MDALVGHTWSDLVLPPGLKLGAGSSASQIEGAWDVNDKSLSIIDTLFHGNVTNGDDACKSYELWKTDVELIKKLGLQIYRFSIPWTRILPTGKPDYINQVAVDHYNRLIDALLEIKVEPMVTILHFDLPQSFQDLGGWHNPEFPGWLADYARVLFALYGDRVKTWFTVNEPIVSCYYFENIIFDQPQPNLCGKNLLLGHASAWRVYDKEFRDKQHGQVTLVNNLLWFEAEYDDDEPLAELMRKRYGGVYSNPIFSEEGGWPRDIQEALADTRDALPELTREEIDLMKGTYDFYALNYYTARVVRKAQVNETIGPWPFSGSPELGAILENKSSKFKNNKYDKTSPIYPKSIRAQMNWLNKQYGVTRFVVTENGMSNNGTLKDREKIVYVQDHIQQIVLAIKEDGLDVFGYSAWSFLDNFEFVSGYQSKYGLYSVNFTDPLRARTPRDSFYYYKNLIANSKNRCSIKLVTNDGSVTKEDMDEDENGDSKTQSSSYKYNEKHLTSSRQSQIHSNSSNSKSTMTTKHKYKYC